MKSIKYGLGVASLFVLMGQDATDCGSGKDDNDTGLDDSGDMTEDTSDDDDAVATIQQWFSECTGDTNSTNDGDGEWEFRTRVEPGTATEVVLYVVQSTDNPFDDEYSLTETSSDDDQTFGTWEFDITADATTAAWNNNPQENSLLGCNDLNEDDNDFNVTFALGVWNGDDLTDCVIFGDDPESVLDGTATTTIPEWVTTDNCDEADPNTTDNES